MLLGNKKCCLYDGEEVIIIKVSFTEEEKQVIKWFSDLLAEIHNMNDEYAIGLVVDDGIDFYDEYRNYIDALAKGVTDIANIGYIGKR